MALRAALAAALLLASVSPARAQDTSSGMCTGTVTGYVGLAVPVSGALQGVGSNFVNSVFGAAECDCDTRDVTLQIQAKTAFPTGTTGSLEVWVGNGCDNYDTRNNAATTTCERITDLGGIEFNNFVTGMSSTGLNYINIPIAARKLFSPKVNVCDPTQSQTNYIYVFLSTTDVRNPAATCTLPVKVANLPPSPPANPSATGGEEAVTLRWERTVGGNPILNYQILCADESGNPVPGLFKDDQQAYSACIGGAIKRRPFPSTTGTVAVDDMGTTTTTDLGTATLLWPEQAVDDLAAPDLASGRDMVVPTGPTAFASTLDPAYICSEKLGLATLEYRINGLQNNARYQFVVLAINESGNVAASDLLIASPEPAEDLWRRLRDSGANPNGFCEVGGSATRPLWLIEALAALALAAWLLLRHARRP